MANGETSHASTDDITFSQMAVMKFAKLLQIPHWIWPKMEGEEYAECHFHAVMIGCSLMEPHQQIRLWVMS